MNIEHNGRLQTVETGQLWKVEHGYVQIVDSADALIRYRLLKQPNQRAGLTRAIGLEALLNYLHQSEAELINPPAQA